MLRSSTPAGPETANDRFKRGFARWFFVGLTLATLLHALLFVATPGFDTEDYGFQPDELSVFEIPDEIEIPPPPAAVLRPAAPVIVDAAAIDDDDLTIAPTTLEANPVENLPPPPAVTQEAERELAAAPVFTPYTVRPRLLNAGEVQAALLRYYPPLLKDAGIGGRVTVWFFIDETGNVVKTQINRSSGFNTFDEAALDVADLMRFTPAYNRNDAVPVWVSIPVVFEVMP
jgi:TonB family protein